MKKAKASQKVKAKAEALARRGKEKEKAKEKAKEKEEKHRDHTRRQEPEQNLEAHLPPDRRTDRRASSTSMVDAIKATNVVIGISRSVPSSKEENVVPERSAYFSMSILPRPLLVAIPSKRRKAKINRLPIRLPKKVVQPWKCRQTPKAAFGRKSSFQEEREVAGSDVKREIHQRSPPKRKEKRQEAIPGCHSI